MPPIKDYRAILPMPLTQEAVEAKIRSDLGHPRRIVEIDAFQMAGAITDSLDLFNRFKAKELFGYRQHVSGRISITITNNDVYDVTQVDFLDENIVDYDNLNVFELDFRIKNLKGGSGDYFEYRMINSMNKRAFSSDPDWNYDNDSRVLLIHAAGGPYTIQYTMVVPYRLDNIPRNFYNIFLRTVLAYAKLRLYEMRSRTPLMLPTGNERDGENFKTEAEDALAKIESELPEPAPPIVGY